MALCYCHYTDADDIDSVGVKSRRRRQWGLQFDLYRFKLDEIINKEIKKT